MSVPAPSIGQSPTPEAPPNPARVTIPLDFRELVFAAKADMQRLCTAWLAASTPTPMHERALDDLDALAMRLIDIRQAARGLG